MATQDLVLTAPEPKQPTFIEMIEYAVKNGGAIDVIERLAKLRDEERDYRNKVSFDEALTRCQQRIAPILANRENKATGSKYPDYEQIDRTIRPIYTAEDFSLSFSEADCPTPGKTRIIAYLSRCGHTRQYMKDLYPPVKGPKGNDVMTLTHADGAADSYGKRYLVGMIFNIAVTNDTDGNASGADPDWLNEQLMEIDRCETPEGVVLAFQAAAKVALEASDMSAYNALKRAKNARKKELEGK